mgnify:CR=1 FL=1
MAKRNARNRSDISERTERSRNDMRGKEGDMGEIVEDVETVRGTLESLDLGGTEEGADAVEIAIHGADDITAGIFDREDGQLDGIQNESEEHQSELQERSDSDHGDLDKISDGSSRITTGETVNEILKAKEAALHDVDFLGAHIEQAESAREESEQIQREYQQRVHAKGR